MKDVFFFSGTEKEGKEKGRASIQIFRRAKE